MLKTCDTPHNFPCRLTEDSGAASRLQTESATNPDNRQQKGNDGRTIQFTLRELRQATSLNDSESKLSRHSFK